MSGIDVDQVVGPGRFARCASHASSRSPKDVQTALSLTNNPIAWLEPTGLQPGLRRLLPTKRPEVHNPLKEVEEKWPPSPASANSGRLSHRDENPCSIRAAAQIVAG